MTLQLDIEFDQLVKLAKKLPVTQWKKLKKEVDEHVTKETQTSDLENLLLAAPTFSKIQLNELAKTRKAINQWRTK